jgi:hypothetical protein
MPGMLKGDVKTSECYASARVRTLADPSVPSAAACYNAQWMQAIAKGQGCAYRSHRTNVAWSAGSAYSDIDLNVALAALVELGVQRVYLALQSLDLGFERLYFPVIFNE